MATPTQELSLDELNRMERATFVQVLGRIFEHSPWVAERVGGARPFPSGAELHRAMTDVVRKASAAERLALLRAHPDLAGNAARAGAMTASSTQEQARAGLDRLTDEEHARFGRLNAAYQEKFGFPFIICVRDHTKQSILDSFERRLGNPVDAEIEAALAEVSRITRYRLDALLGAAPRDTARREPPA